MKCCLPVGEGEHTFLRCEKEMNSAIRMFFPSVIAVLIGTVPALPQSRPDKPALIRDTDLAEGKEQAEEDKPKPYDPLLAEKNFKIGEYYFKRKNYSAAIQRFLEAIEYHPGRIESYEALGKAYEKNDQDEKALEVYRDFLRKYPDSPKASSFEKKISKLDKRP